MNESENNFEALRRLLALKRHEIPPPGYFNTFASRVTSRIQAGETAETWEAVEPWWLLKFLQVFEAKPAYVGSFACALCLLLLFGIVYAERPDATLKSNLLAAVTQPAVPLADVASPILTASSGQGGLMVATNPIISLAPVAALFGQQSPLPQAMNVNFSVPGN